ncbi:hypothetical protein XF35_28570 [Streptomyces platensis subsp. clarensis]|nr:hypothetical protein [Streptomyces platensis subsp. clarensis]
MWLFSQRNRAKQRARKGKPTTSPHLGQLAAIDPWWNPPWHLHWQRNYYRARDSIRAGRGADTVGGLPVGKDARGKWVKRQCTLYDSLHPDLQHLLAAVGITLEAARARVGPRDSRRQPWRCHQPIALRAMDSSRLTVSASISPARAAASSASTSGSAGSSPRADGA